MSNIIHINSYFQKYLFEPQQQQRYDDDICLVWMCSCGSQTFILYEGGDIACAECETVSSTIAYYVLDEPPPVA